MSIKIHTLGTSTLSRVAELALVNMEVSCTGDTQPAVSLEVTNTSNYLQSQLKTLSLESLTDNHLDQDAITRWSMSSLSTGSYIPWDTHKGGERECKPVYTGRTTFQVTFRNFAKLGQAVSDIAQVPHVSVVSIEWQLTTLTKLEMRRASRKKAVEDAVEKVRDYAEALGRTSWEPLEVSDTDIEDDARSAVVYMPNMGGRMAGRNHQENSLQFTPQECEIRCSVKVLFEAS